MRLRMITYNIHKCIGGIDRRYRPERIRDTIAHYDPDLVMLQEVDAGALRSNGDRQVDRLGDMLELPHRAFFPNVQVRGGGAYGNAILSRFPVTESNNIDVTVKPKKCRSVLHARCRVRLGGALGARTLHVFNLHLGLSGLERKIQLRRFLDGEPCAGLHATTPVILAGDFNDVYGTLGGLLGPAGFATTMHVVPTFPAYAPVRALDGIYVRGGVSIEHMFRSRLHLARTASDHLPLIADLEIEP